MTQTVSKVPVLSASQLTELLHLLKGADSVELKLSVPDSDQRSAVGALGLDPLDAQIRQVTFFDTPDLALYDHGVVVRARRVQGKLGDSTVKLRPVVPETLPAALRKSPAFGVEVDAMPGGVVCSASMKAAVDNDAVKDVYAGRRPLRKLLSKEQRKFFAAHSPDGLELEQLSILGPINILKLKCFPADYGRRLVAELWFNPDGTRILELSTKTAPNEAFEIAAATKAYLANKGIDLLAAQQTKTKATLEYFARARSMPLVSATSEVSA